ncbi:MAG TPA: extracellular solute-binding protein [Acidimicrobiales bacterium]|nr:extracellular solute-binding protein [Acidimicrobiales bacterium]
MTNREPLRVALVGGPMYDHLYRCFGEREVEVVVHADHPTLNRRAAELLAAGARIDLLATHAKYAPSQAPWLHPLEDLVAPELVGALAPRAVDLCRFAGDLLCLPRLIDVRVLWVRRDRVAAPPTDWAQLLGDGVRFGFPGRESGLFGTFFELVVGAGGTLFDDAGRPLLDGPGSEEAVDTLVALARRAPPDLPSWHYDQVDEALLSGRIDAAGCWPGAWGAIRDAAVGGLLEPHPYPSGPARWVTYAGCHAWAVPRTCGDLPGALALLERLVGFEAQALDASGGNVCAHTGALEAVEPENELDARRLAVTRQTIESAMITYPPSARFPDVEDAGWSALRDALIGTCTAEVAVRRMQLAAEAVMGDATRG